MEENRTKDTWTADPPCGAPELPGTETDWKTTSLTEEEDLDQIKEHNKKSIILIQSYNIVQINK